ncbi:hypothetical protein BGZ82_010925 [Podila clonocystis]|nr:hypothetical protein BGZ82_010925 [Podila clonocystis]
MKTFNLALFYAMLACLLMGTSAQETEATDSKIANNDGNTCIHCFVYPKCFKGCRSNEKCVVIKPTCDDCGSAHCEPKQN